MRTVLGIALLACVTARAQEAAPPAPPAPAPETAAPGAAPAEQTPDQRFRHGKNLFEYGDCAGSIDTLAPLAVPGKLPDEKEELDAHRMLGVCYALGGKETESEREFSSLLSLDPDFALDPFLTPPAAIEVFDRQKKAMKERLDELRRAREKLKSTAIDAKGGVLLERSTVVRDVPLAVSFMPFGLAQAANGETVKAVIVGATQGATLAATVVGFWGSMALLGAEPKTKAEALTVTGWYQGFLVTEGVAAMGFALAYGYGAWDALWNREDRVVVERKEEKRPLTPAEIEALKKIPRSAAPPAPTAAAAP